MKKLFASMLFVVFSGTAFTQPTDGGSADTLTFRFFAGKDFFYSPWGGNGAEIERLYSLVDTYRGKITSGEMPVREDGYCASRPTTKENRRIAFIRSNRVKSEMITNKGLKEEHFRTRNHTEPFEGQRDVVIVRFILPVKAVPEPAPEPAPVPVPEPPVPVVEPVPAPEPEPVVEEPTKERRSIRLDVRTNLLYDALLLPTVGLEWRVNRYVGIQLEGSRSWWGNEHGKVQKIWMFSPEVRWYLLRDNRFYAGVSANIGQFNVYKYAIGGIASKDTGYQGSLWGAGLTVGYQLPVAKRLAVEFNLGLGYTRFEYDKFGIRDRMRFSKERDCTRNFWGPTEAGVSLIWTIGKVR